MFDTSESLGLPARMLSCGGISRLAPSCEELVQASYWRVSAEQLCSQYFDVQSEQALGT